MRASSPPSGCAPGILRQLYHQPQLGFLHSGIDGIAQLGAGEAALWADGEAFEWDEGARLVYALPQRGLVFEEVGLGRDQAEHGGFLLRHEAQRREIARARAIVFEEEEADVERVEQRLGDRLVASL